MHTAQIRERAVIDKIINDLRLNPQFDAIPTELMDKVLPVFQINDTGETTVLSNVVTGNAVKSFIVPDNEEWELDYSYCEVMTTATVGTRRFTLSFKDKNGVIVLRAPATTTTGSNETSMDIVQMTAGLGLGVSGTLGEGRIPANFRLKPGMAVTFTDLVDIDDNDTLLWHIGLRKFVKRRL